MTEQEGKAGQYARQADAWSDIAYADTGTYLAARAARVVSLGAALLPGDEVLDLACGDAGLALALRPYGLRYRGVDAEPAMIDAARARLGADAPVEVADLNDYVPPGPVAATTCFRAIYYVRDREAFFAAARGYTRRKLVFDLNPRQYPVEQIVAELEGAGFIDIRLRPFLVPQTHRLPRPVVAGLTAPERVGPVARTALRYRFTYVVAASVER
jgi:hypothetical protein